MTLTEFIEARLGEDEAAAKAAQEEWDIDWVRYERGDLPDGVYAHTVRHDPARVLREVEAGRKILALHPLTDKIVPYGCRDFPFGCETCHDWDGATEGHGYCDTLKTLAAVYADHPDWKEAWRP